MIDCDPNNSLFGGSPYFGIMFQYLSFYLYKFVCCRQRRGSRRNSSRTTSFLFPWDSSSSHFRPRLVVLDSQVLDTRIRLPSESSLSTSKRTPPQCRCLPTKHESRLQDPSYTSVPRILWWYWRQQRPGVLPPSGRSPQHQSSSLGRCSRSSSGHRSSPSLLRRIRRTCPRCSRILKGFVLVTAGGNIHGNIHGLGILPKVRPAFFIRTQCLAASAPASASATEMLALRGVSWAWGNV